MIAITMVTKGHEGHETPFDKIFMTFKMAFVTVVIVFVTFVVLGE